MEKILVLIPTYNERENIIPLLKEVFRFSPEAHVWVIDDNSPDGTAEAVSDFAEEDPRVRLISRPEKEGLGAAYLQGIEAALEEDYDRIVTMDGDFSHNPAAIPSLVHVTDNADLAIGSRFVAGGKILGGTWFRSTLTWITVLLGRYFTGFPAKDCSSGFRCYRTSMLKEINLSPFKALGYDFQEEMLYRAMVGRFRIRETPIEYEFRGAGKSKMTWGDIFQVLGILILLRFRDLRRSRRPAYLWLVYIFMAVSFQFMFCQRLYQEKLELTISMDKKYYRVGDSTILKGILANREPYPVGILSPPAVAEKTLEVQIFEGDRLGHWSLDAPFLHLLRGGLDMMPEVMSEQFLEVVLPDPRRYEYLGQYFAPRDMTVRIRELQPGEEVEVKEDIGLGYGLPPGRYRTRMAYRTINHPAAAGGKRVPYNIWYSDWVEFEVLPDAPFELEVEVSLAKEKFQFGDLIWLSGTIRNPNNESVDLLTVAIEEKTLEVRLRDETGKKLRFGRLILPSPSTERTKKTLKPEESISFSERLNFLRVLVIEDEPDFQGLMHENLTSRGYEVILAPDGDIGVERTLGDRPDVIIMDLIMPEQDGFDAIREIRGFPQFSDVPIVVVTGSTDEEVEDGAEQAGAQTVINKPVDFELLDRTIKVLKRAYFELFPGNYRLEIYYSSLPWPRAGVPYSKWPANELVFEVLPGE